MSINNQDPNIDDLIPKVENEGETPAGTLTADNWNRLVSAVKETQGSIKSITVNGSSNNVKRDNYGNIDLTIASDGYLAIFQQGSGANTILFGKQALIKFAYISLDGQSKPSNSSMIYLYQASNDQQSINQATLLQTYRPGDQSANETDYKYSFDVTDNITAESSYYFIVYIKDESTNQTAISRWVFTSVDFRLKNNYDFTTVNSIQSTDITKFLKYQFTPYGVGINKNFTFTVKHPGSSVYNSLEETAYCGGGNTFSGNYASVTLNPEINILNWAHGAHTIKVEANATINGELINCDPIYIDIIVIRQNNLNPVIVVDRATLKTEAKSYETISTSFAVYDPNAINNVGTVNCYSNANNTGYELSTSFIKVSKGTWNYFVEKITNVETYNTTLKLTCLTTEYILPVITVSGSVVDINDTYGYSLNLYSKGRTNSESADIRNRWMYNDVNYATFTNFNWVSNGWMIDTNGDIALKISNGASLSIDYKPFTNERTLKGFTFELDFSVSNVIDTTKTIIECFENNIGFKITPQLITMQCSDGKLIKTNYKEDERLRVSFTIFPENIIPKKGMRLYANANEQSFNTYTTGAFDQGVNAKIISFISTYCDIYIYNIRFYEFPIDSASVINNYIVGLTDTEDMLSRFYKNDVYNQNKISVGKVRKILPVMILENIKGAEPAAKYTVQELSDAADKKNKTYVNIYYYDDFTRDSENITYKNFKTYGSQLKLQGTSSLGYPRKNFKIYMKGLDTFTYTDGYGKVSNKKGKYALRPNNYDLKTKSFAVGTFCLKADFAESSGAHNTGAAKLFNEVLKLSNYKSPAQTGYTGTNDVRTTIDGFPIVLFQKDYGQSDDEAEFIGKYNFNNDKSTQDVFGFENVTGYNDTLVNNTNIVPYTGVDFLTDSQDPSITTDNKYVELNPTSANYLHQWTYGDTWTKSTSTVSLNPCQCWEFLKNEYALCMFDLPSAYSSMDTIPMNDETNGGWLDCFESRYPEVYSNDESFAELKVNDSYINMSELQKVVKWVYSCNIFNITDETEISNRKNKFKNELKNHFNINNICAYFALTDFFAAVDQRAKNQMMTSWGNEGSGDYKWYFIFYDNDTILGLENAGTIRYNYDLESDTIDTLTGNYAYSGRNSILWRMLELVFHNEIQDAYLNINKSGVTYKNCINYFNVQQSDKWPEAVYNEDSQFKYENYVNYYASAQGSREQHRKWWLQNRSNYVDGKYGGQSFKSGGGYFRANASTIEFRLTAARTQYYGTSYSTGGRINTFKLQAGNTSDSIIYAGGNNVDIYVYALDQITKFENLDSLKITDASFVSKCSLLEEIKLGVYDTTQAKIGLLKLPLTTHPNLKKIEVGNCYSADFTGIDCLGCPRIEYIDMRGSSVKSLTLQDRCAINTIKYGEDLTSINLSNQSIAYSGLSFLDKTHISEIKINNCPNVKALTLLNDVYNSNNNLSIVELLNITEGSIDARLTSADIDALYKVAVSTTITSNITGTIYIDTIGNLDYYTITNKYPELIINYNTIENDLLFQINCANTINEGTTSNISVIYISGNENQKGVVWSLSSWTGAAKYIPTIDDGETTKLIIPRNDNLNITKTDTFKLKATSIYSSDIYAEKTITVNAVAINNINLTTYNGVAQAASGDVVLLQVAKSPNTATKKISSTYFSFSDPTLVSSISESANEQGYYELTIANTQNLNTNLTITVNCTTGLTGESLTGECDLLINPLDFYIEPIAPITEGTTATVNIIYSAGNQSSYNEVNLSVSGYSGNKAYSPTVTGSIITVPVNYYENITKTYSFKVTATSVYDSSISDTATVLINAVALESVLISEQNNKSTFKTGETGNFKVSVLPLTTTKIPFYAEAWSFSEPDIATVGDKVNDYYPITFNGNATTTYNITMTYTGTVTTQNSKVSATYTILLNNLPKVGYLAYSDGTFSSNYDNSKTIIGWVYYVDDQYVRVCANEIFAINPYAFNYRSRVISSIPKAPNTTQTGIGFYTADGINTTLKAPFIKYTVSTGEEGWDTLTVAYTANGVLDTLYAVSGALNTGDKVYSSKSTDSVYAVIITNKGTNDYVYISNYIDYNNVNNFIVYNNNASLSDWTITVPENKLSSKYSTGDIVPSGYYYTNEIVEDRKTYTGGQSGCATYVTTEQNARIVDINSLKTVAEELKTSSGLAGQEVRFGISYCNLYQPNIDNLSSLYSKGNWYCPSIAEILRITYYDNIHIMNTNNSITQMGVIKDIVHSSIFQYINTAYSYPSSTYSMTNYGAQAVTMWSDNDTPYDNTLANNIIGIFSASANHSGVRVMPCIAIKLNDL